MTAQALPPLVVLIPTHDRLRLLERTVDSVQACTPPDGRDVRLIVVENGGRFGVDAMLARKPGWLRLEYQYCERPNKSDALNACIAGLGEALVLFLDDDVRASPQLLTEYSRAAGGRRANVMFGGGMLVDYETPPPAWLLDYLPASARGWHPESYVPISRTMAFMGCNWAAFSHDIRRAGGFNARFGPGGLSGGTGQERAMQMALAEAGCVPEYVRDAVVWHYVPADRCSARWTLQRTYRNAITTGYELSGLERQSRIAGVPRPMLRRACKQALDAAKARFLSGSEQRFLAMHAFLTTCGMIQGVRKRHRDERIGA